MENENKPAAAVAAGTIDRYDAQRVGPATMVGRENGEYVLYADHVANIAACKQAREEAEAELRMALEVGQHYCVRAERAESQLERVASQRTAGGDAVAICEKMIAFFNEKGRPELGSAVGQVLSQIRHKQSLQPVPEAAAQADGELLNAIIYGVPLTEPVSVAKAMMAQCPAKAVLASGTGPVSAVHLVNIGITGWVHTPETAKAYADGFNRATEWLRSAIRSYAAAPTAQPTPEDGTPKLTLALPDWEKRRVVIVSDEYVGDERLVCIAFEGPAV